MTAIVVTNSVSQNEIELLARRLQALPAEIRWAYIEHDAILAAATGAPATFGPWKTRIGWLLKCAAMVWLDLIAAKIHKPDTSRHNPLLSIAHCINKQAAVFLCRHCSNAGGSTNTAI